RTCGCMMSRARLLSVPLSARERLRYLRELLDWAYAAERGPQWIQGAFWEWFIGMTHEQAVRDPRGSMATIMRETEDWNWITFQQNVRSRLEELLRGSIGRRQSPVVRLGHTLTQERRGDGRFYFSYGPTLPDPLTEDGVVAVAIDEALKDLSGFD